MTSAQDHKSRVQDALNRYYASVEALPQDERRDLEREAYREAHPKAKACHAVPTEHEEQADVVRWLRARKHKVFATCNGVVFGLMGLAAAKYHSYLTAEGKSKGVPDLIIGPPVGSRVMTAVEMKRSVGGVVSSEQQAWLDALESWGWKVLVANGADEAIRKLTELGY